MQCFPQTDTVAETIDYTGLIDHFPFNISTYNSSLYSHKVPLCVHQAFPFIAPRHISVPHPYCFSFSTYCMLCWLFLLAAGFTNHPKHNFRLSFFNYFNKRVCILACGKYRCLSKWSKPMYQCSPHYPNELTVEASDKGTSRLALNYSPYIQFMYKRNIREILLSLSVFLWSVCVSVKRHLSEATLDWPLIKWKIFSWTEERKKYI